MTTKKNVSTIYLRTIPTNLKAAFKSAVALRNKTMQEVMIKLIREYVRKADEFK